MFKPGDKLVTKKTYYSGVPSDDVVLEFIEYTGGGRFAGQVVNCSENTGIYDEGNIDDNWIAEAFELQSRIYIENKHGEETVKWGHPDVD